MASVIGVGGVFVKTHDPEGHARWRFGYVVDPEGTLLELRQP
jgi:hypothetical protein